MHQLERILTISQQLGETHNVAPLLIQAVDAALEMFNAQYGYLILLDEADTLDFRVQRDQQGNPVEQPGEQVSRTILDQVIRAREDLLLTDAVNDPVMGDVDSIWSLKLRSVMCVPMITRDEVIGALYVENRQAASVFTEKQLRLLRLLASQAAVAIENARLNEGLERRVAARTRELEIAIAELDAFAQTVAHDLKHPLGLIQGYAGILAEQADQLNPDDRQRYAEIIQRRIEKMNEIIEALLLLANTSLEVEMVPVPMGAVVEKAVTYLAATISEKGAEVIVQEDWPTVTSYGPWLEAVWVNYLSNALKYGGDPPQIELGWEVLPEGGWRFYIADNGLGIAPEDIDKLFVPFVRLTQGQIAGHGLGLSIVQRVMTKLGGEVGVESTPGEGSMFSFTLYE